MTDKQPSHQHGKEEGFERQDFGAKTVYWFLIGLAALGVVVYLINNATYSYLNHYEQAHEPKLTAMKHTLETDLRDTQAAKVKRMVDQTFPEPRLQTSELNELTGFRLKEEDQLSTYGWVDQQTGTAHIPIERAMQIVADRGLPVRPGDANSGEAAGKMPAIKSAANRKGK
jgi:hypothetical protein